MTRRIPRIAALGLTALCATALAGPAQAATSKPSGPLPTVRHASFSITIEGVQRTTWKYTHTGSGGCDTDATGTGTETIRFGTAKRRVVATDITGLAAPVLRMPGSYRSPKLTIRGSVSRDGTMNVKPGDGGCGGGVGTPTPRDCGRRTIKGVAAELQYRLSAKVKDQLEVRPTVPKDPYRNCPSGGYSYPHLITSRHGAPLALDMPRDELFNRRYGKLITIANGVEESTTGESIYRTTTRWVVTIERLGVKRRS